MTFSKDNLNAASYLIFCLYITYEPISIIMQQTNTKYDICIYQDNLKDLSRDIFSVAIQDFRQNYSFLRPLVDQTIQVFKDLTLGAASLRNIHRIT